MSLLGRRRSRLGEFEGMTSSGGEGKGGERAERSSGERIDRCKNQASLPPALLLPTHVIARVFSQLDCVDLLSCSLVCKQWYRDSAELKEDWKNEYREALYFYGIYFKKEAVHQPPMKLTGAQAYYL